MEKLFVCVCVRQLFEFEMSTAYSALEFESNASEWNVSVVSFNDGRVSILKIAHKMSTLLSSCEPNPFPQGYCTTPLLHSYSMYAEMPWNL